MRRDQLEHAIRAACQVTGQLEVIVVGSQAILGTYPEYELPLERVWKGVYGAWAGCQGRRPGGGARRRAMRPIMAHLTMASEWVGKRS